jgi:hypothetical protein
MSLSKRGKIWWYEFRFSGQRIQESSKSSSKTLARAAEQKRRRELEEGFNDFEDKRHERVRTFNDLADEFFNGYKLRLPDSAIFAEYAIDHLKRLVGTKCLLISMRRRSLRFKTNDSMKAPRRRPSTRKSAFCSASSESRAT